MSQAEEEFLNDQCLWNTSEKGEKIHPVGKKNKWRT